MDYVNAANPAPPVVTAKVITGAPVTTSGVKIGAPMDLTGLYTVPVKITNTSRSTVWHFAFHTVVPARGAFCRHFSQAELLPRLHACCKTPAATPPPRGSQHKSCSTVLQLN